MYRFTALGDGDNASAFALGTLARDLSDEEYEAAASAGLLSEDAAALFEHVPDGGGGGKAAGAAGPTPARRAKPEEGVDAANGKDGE